MLIGMILCGSLRAYGLESNIVFVIAVLVSAVKDGSYLIFATQWTVLSTKFYPRKILGTIYGFGYFFGHLLLAIFSAVYSSVETFILKKEFIIDILGDLRMVLFFFMLGAPLILIIVLTFQIQREIHKKDGLYV